MICLYLKTPEEFVCLILLNRFWVEHIPFVCMVKLQFLAQFPVDHFPTQLCLVLYSICANLLYSLIMFCCILSILALIWLVLMVLFCAAIRRDSVSLLRFPFLSQVHIFLREKSLVNYYYYYYFTKAFQAIIFKPNFIMFWTSSVWDQFYGWSLFQKLACMQILQNFWLTLLHAIKLVSNL